MGYLLAPVMAFMVGFVMGVTDSNVSGSAAGAYSVVWSLIGLSAGGFIMGAADPNDTGGAAGTAGWLIGSITILVISGWVVKQKQRSLWWLLLAGWFPPIPLLLANKKRNQGRGFFSH